MAKRSKPARLKPYSEISGEHFSRVEEADLNYWIGRRTSLTHPVQSFFKTKEMADKGLKKSDIDNLAEHLGVSRKTMAEKILMISVKTLERKNDDTLDRRASSHALEVARLMQHAFRVFEDQQKIKDWLRRGDRALSGFKPIDLLNTLSGINMVNDVLGRIEEGVYS